MSNIDLSSESLGKRTSSIFCDDLAADAATKTEKLCTENNFLEPIAKTLRTLKMYGATEEAIELDVNLYDSEDGDFFVYNIDDNVPPFPHEDLRENYIILSGVRFSHGIFIQPTRFSIEDDGTLLIAYSFGDALLYVQGKLENYQGTLDEIQGTIDTNQAGLYFSSLGLTIAGTGRGLDNLGADTKYLGSTIKLETIKISKAVVERAINTGIKLKEDEDDILVNLEKLCLAFPEYDNLVEVTEKYKTTMLRNKQLVSSREMFQSMVVSIPNGPLFQLKLGSGSIETMMGRETGPIPSWRMRPTDTDEVTVPLSSLADLSFSLGNVRICASRDQSFGGAQIIQGSYLAMGYNGRITLEICFAFDNSIEEFLENEDLFDRIRSSTVSDQGWLSNVVHSRGVQLQPVRMHRNGRQIERLPERVTVRLVFVQVSLEGVQSRLDLLRIPTDNEEGEVEAGNISEEEDDPAESNDQGQNQVGQNE